MTSDKIKTTLATSIELSKLTDELMEAEHFEAAKKSMKRLNDNLMLAHEELVRLADAEAAKAKEAEKKPEAAKPAAAAPAAATKPEPPREAVPAAQAAPAQAG